MATLVLVPIPSDNTAAAHRETCERPRPERSQLGIASDYHRRCGEFIQLTLLSELAASGELLVGGLEIATLVCAKES